MNNISKEDIAVSTIARIGCDACGTPRYCEEYNGKPCSTMMRVARTFYARGYRTKEELRLNIKRTYKQEAQNER